MITYGFSHEKDELVIHLHGANSFDDVRKELQKAFSDPRWKRGSTIMVAFCERSIGSYDMIERKIAADIVKDAKPLKVGVLTPDKASEYVTHEYEMLLKKDGVPAEAFSELQDLFDWLHER